MRAESKVLVSSFMTQFFSLSLSLTRQIFKHLFSKSISFHIRPPISEALRDNNPRYVSTKNPCNYWKDLNRKLEKHNVERVGFHQLRHIYSSVSASLGIDNEIRKQNGGWSNEKIMDGTYRHPMSEAQKEANQKMNNFVGLVSQGTTKSTTVFKKRLKIKRFGT